jgi:hypothetical protein
MDGVRYKPKLYTLIILFIAFSGGFGLSSCAILKPVKQPIPAVEQLPQSEVIPALITEPPGLIQLSAQFVIESEDILDLNQLKGVLRIHRDSAIWINLIHPSGIPIARALFTPDSFFVINRIEKEYEAGTYADFNSKYGVPVAYKNLECAMMARMDPDFQITSSVARQDTLINIIGFDPVNYQQVNYLISADPRSLIYQSVILFKEKILQVDYLDFQADHFYFPLGHQYELKEAEKTRKLNLNFSKLETNSKLEFPFQKQK